MAFHTYKMKSLLVMFQLFVQFLFVLHRYQSVMLIDIIVSFLLCDVSFVPHFWHVKYRRQNYGTQIFLLLITELDVI